MKENMVIKADLFYNLLNNSQENTWFSSSEKEPYRNRTSHKLPISTIYFLFFPTSDALKSLIVDYRRIETSPLYAYNVIKMKILLSIAFINNTLKRYIDIKHWLKKLKNNVISM